MFVLIAWPYFAAGRIEDQLPLQEHRHLIKKSPEPVRVILIPWRAGRKPEAELSVFDDVSVCRHREPTRSVESRRLRLRVIPGKHQANGDRGGDTTVGLQNEITLKVHPAGISIQAKAQAGIELFYKSFFGAQDVSVRALEPCLRFTRRTTSTVQMNDSRNRLTADIGTLSTGRNVNGLLEHGRFACAFDLVLR